MFESRIGLLCFTDDVARRVVKANIDSGGASLGSKNVVALRYRAA